MSTGTGLELSEVVSCRDDGNPAWITGAAGLFDLQVRPGAPASIAESVAAARQAMRKVERWRNETSRLTSIPSSDDRAAAWVDLAATVKREAAPVVARLQAAHAVLEAEAARPGAPPVLAALARGAAWNSRQLAAEVERLTDPARHAGLIDRRAVRACPRRPEGRPALAVTTETRRHGNYGRAATKVGRAPGGGTTVEGVHGLEPSLALWAAVLAQALSDVRSAILYAKHGEPLSARNGEAAAARHAVAWLFAPVNPDRAFVLGVLGVHEDALYRELVRWHGRDLTHVLGGDAIGELDRRLRLSVPGGVASVEPRVPIAPSSRRASARLEQAPRRPRGRPRRAPQGLDRGGSTGVQLLRNRAS